MLKDTELPKINANSTAQEVFDVVANHLLTQNEQSIVYNSFGQSRCRYRGNNGMKCAIGVLIPDELYSPSIENRSVLCEALTERYSDIIPYQHKYLLCRLQVIHDDYPPDKWGFKLRELALSFNLTYKFK